MTSTQTFDLNSLIRSHIAGMETYTPILPFEVLSAQLGIPAEEIVKLDANENPYGPSPQAVQAIAKFPYLHIYPDPESRELRRALSNYTGLPADYLMVGHGADELIDLVMRLFITPGDKIINCPPTFGMYAFDAGVNGAGLIDVRRRTDFSLDIPAIETAVARHKRAKLLFITSPNNPDGSVISETDLKRLLNLPIVVILDEAYVEFHSRSFITWVLEHTNLFVLRTFSKWAGLAGLRVGYGALPLAIMEHLWKIKQPYNVNVAGQVAALASLQDTTYLKQNVAKIIATREQFQGDLAQIPWLRPYPSQTNFVLAKVIDRNAAQIKKSLAKQGILVRYYNSSGLQDHLRFSIGKPEHMARLLEGLKSL
jgi:histidinol-phosphate aminotransferase